MTSPTPEFWDALTETIWPTEHLAPVRDALAYVDQRWPDLPVSDAEPIFIIASAWRAGSTLLQRLVNSDRATMMFGEPYEHMMLWHHMAAQWRRFGGHDELHSSYLPADYASMDPDRLHDVLTRNFTATMTPQVADLKRAHYAYFDALFHDPVAQVGRKRWGMKLVRADAVVLDYLMWLYPRGRFLFVVRDPVAAWTSYATVIGADKRAWDLYAETHKIATATQFALVWRRCVRAMVPHLNDPKVMLVRYEALNATMDLSALERFIGATVDREALRVVTGASLGKRPAHDSDVQHILTVCADTMKVIGY